jgi:hypothetical protein
MISFSRKTKQCPTWIFDAVNTIICGWQLCEFRGERDNDGWWQGTITLQRHNGKLYIIEVPILGFGWLSPDEPLPFCQDTICEFRCYRRASLLVTIKMLYWLLRAKRVPDESTS